MGTVGAFFFFGTSVESHLCFCFLVSGWGKVAGCKWLQYIDLFATFFFVDVVYTSLPIDLRIACMDKHG